MQLLSLVFLFLYSVSAFGSGNQARFTPLGMGATQSEVRVVFRICFRDRLPNGKDATSAGIGVTKGNERIRLIRQEILPNCEGEDTFLLKVTIEGSEFSGKGEYELQIRNIYVGRIPYRFAGYRPIIVVSTP